MYYSLFITANKLGLDKEERNNSVKRRQKSVYPKKKWLPASLFSAAAIVVCLIPNYLSPREILWTLPNLNKQSTSLIKLKVNVPTTIKWHVDAQSVL